VTEQNTLNSSAGHQSDEAIDAVLKEAYPDLKRMARRQLRRESSKPFQTTELVNEAMLRWFTGTQDQPSPEAWMAIMARVMRNVLVDEARARKAQKRGNDPIRMTLNTKDAATEASADPVEVLDLNAALAALHAMDARKADIIECHYFGGMTVVEMGAHFKLGEATVKRDLITARAWIGSQLKS